MRYLIILWLVIGTNAHSQSVQWAIKAGGASSASTGSTDDKVNCVKTDVQGNVYICGNFYGSSSNINNFPIANNGSQDAFIAKLDCNANLLWVRTAGGIQEDIFANSIELDSEGHIYLTGQLLAHPTNKWMFFDTLIGDSSLFYSWYLAKFDTSGNFLWGQMAHNNPHTGSIGYDIEIDNDGNPVVSINAIDPEILPGLNLDTGYYLLTLDTAGNFKKILRPNLGHSSIDLKHFKLDGLGNVYVVGSWKSDSINIDGIVYYSPHSSPSQENFLLYSCDSLGETRWYHQFSDSSANSTVNFGNSLVMDSLKNLYVSGNVCNDLWSDNQVFMSPQGWASELQMIAKFDSNGVQQWVHSFPCEFAGRPRFSGVTLKSNGNVVVGYSYQGKSLVGIDTIFPSPNSLADLVLTELTSTGLIVDHEELQGPGIDFATSLASTSSDVIYLGGAFKSQLHYNSQILSSTGGRSDGFVARFGGNCITSLTELTNQYKLSAYPNPVDNFLNVSWDNNFVPINFSIFNFAGQRVIYSSLNQPERELQFDAQYFSGGVYLLQLVDELGNRASIKFIKQ